ncbi:hypothetical protein LAZ67_22001217, partial [Cordylochernes scorpioides]
MKAYYEPIRTYPLNSTNDQEQESEEDEEFCSTNPGFVNFFYPLSKSAVPPSSNQSSDNGQNSSAIRRSTHTDQPSTEGQRRGRLRDEELDVALGVYPEAHCRKVQRRIYKVENSPTRKLNDALKAKAGEGTQLEMTLTLSKYPEARCRKDQRRTILNSLMLDSSSSASLTSELNLVLICLENNRNAGVFPVDLFGVV